ncbi:Calmodulin-lysine N-methyltransferase [Phytophthora cinnamomi]|uniref:Calmodulin-lysine N-methyltransferase n=1 Tax=Phytophthora cinnamomi TaxID=4785 RepID=UPI0035593810|nr:Calmodulin-lysine N-methyltransferase [Phytophthora cinnamomi]
MAADQKTRRHWRVLREALLRSTSSGAADRCSEATASSIASEFFPIYAATAAAATHTPAQENFVWTAYDLSPAASAAPTRVFVHEKRKDVKRVSFLELLSHQVNQGVDNTGNIRTWPSEQILLSYLLESGVCTRVQRRDASGNPLPVTCCELGSGMAGLASLGLLARPPAALQRVVVTDGNPQSVKNLQLCVEENRQQQVFAIHSHNTEVTAELLRWDRDATLREDLRQQFDLVFASDCLFFEEFHEDLAHTIKSLLRPGSGRCLLLQPSRNGSMERFCAIAARHGFAVEKSDDYDPEIVRKHAAYQQTRVDYVPDVHLPVLLTLSQS